MAEQEPSQPAGSFGHSSWELVFGVVLWFLWQWRNNKVFNNIDYPKNGKSIILRYVQDIITAKNSSSLGYNMSRKTELIVGWERTKMGFVKLNTDDSNKGDVGRAGTGGLLRDGDGRWISGFMANMGNCDSLTTKTWAAIYGLEIA